MVGEVKVKVSNFDFASLLFIFYLFIYGGENNITFIKEKNSLHFKLLSSKLHHFILVVISIFKPINPITLRIV